MSPQLSLQTDLQATRAWRIGWVLAGGAVFGLFLWTRLNHTRPTPRPLPTELVSRLTLREGRLFQSGATQPFTGWLEDYHPSASLKSRSLLSNGVLNGLSEGWYTNGVLQISEHFSAGMSAGPITRWYPSGAKLSEGTSLAGKLDGSFRRWHESGVLAEEVHFRKGQAQGRSRGWFPSGYLKAEVELNAGQVITQRFWKDGELRGVAAALSKPGSP